MCKFKSILIKFFFCFLFQRRSRSHFNNFLKSSLHAAIAFKKVYDISIIIAEDLYFNMFWVINIFFYKNSIITESISGLAFRFVERFFERIFLMNYTHSSAAAAGACFKDYRETNSSGFF